MENRQSTLSIKPRVGLAAWVVDDGKVLMGRRLGSHSKNSWACPGGQLEFGEASIDGAKRELLEETNLIAEEVKFTCWTNDIIKEENKHYVSLHIIVTKHAGELKLMEPDKCLEWRWLSLYEIPKELFVPAKNFIETGILQKYMEDSKRKVIS